MSKSLSFRPSKTNLFLKVLLQTSLLVGLFYNHTAKAQTLRIKAVGDIMLGSYTPTTILPPRLGQEFIDSTAALLDSADITFGNLEGVFVTKDIEPQKCSDASREAKRCYEFGMPDTLSRALKEMHFSILSMDNNHNSDYGWKGVEHTKQLLDKHQINYAAKKSPIVLKVPVFVETLQAINGDTIITEQVDTLKVGVIAFGHSSESFQVFDLTTAKEEVMKLDSISDLVLVSFHGGAEGSDAQHIKNETEYFYGENRGNLIQFAHTVIDAGADLVIGHGPHVLRALDLYKGKFICYSLGNFLTHGNVNITGIKGKGAVMDILIDRATGDFVSAEIIPTVQVARGIPVLDSQKEAVKLIKALTEADFPTSELKIHGNGSVKLK